jgi:hypothetical protein
MYARACGEATFTPIQLPSGWERLSCGLHHAFDAAGVLESRGDPLSRRARRGIAGSVVARLGESRFPPSPLCLFETGLGGIDLKGEGQFPTSVPFLTGRLYPTTA